MGISEWWVYVLRCSDGSLYCGISNDVERRLRAHNAGKGSRYVRSRSPAALAFSWPAGTKSQALKAEYEFKQLSKKHKESIVEKQRWNLHSDSSAG